MKRLYLIRHAKSSWDDPSLDDFDRPLSKRGKHDAPLMGKLLKQKNIIPDLILSSPAKRAKKTAKKIAKELGKANIVYLDELYDASSQDLLADIKKISDTYTTVFLIAHNPRLNMLAYDLVDFLQNV